MHYWYFIPLTGCSLKLLTQNIRLMAFNTARQKAEKHFLVLKVSHPMNQASGRVRQFPGRVPPKGTALLTERWPRTSRQSDESSLLFRFAFLLFILSFFTFPLISPGQNPWKRETEKVAYFIPLSPFPLDLG